jgi:hypothetical protein
MGVTSHKEIQAKTQSSGSSKKCIGCQRFAWVVFLQTAQDEISIVGGDCFKGLERAAAILKAIKVDLHHLSYVRVLDPASP